MDYLLFFWFAWMLWVIVFFFMEPSTGRYYFAAIILSIIACAPYSIQGGSYEISLAYGIVILSACIWAGAFEWKYQWRIVISALAVTFLYASFQLMAWYNPVIFLLDDIWVPVVILVFVTLFIHRHTMSRLPTIMLAISFGELLAALVVYPLTGGLYVADSFYYNVLASTIMIVLLWQGVENVTSKMADYSSTPRRGSRRVSI